MHRFRALRLLLPVVVLIPAPALSQAFGPSRDGPVIEGFEPVFGVEGPTFPTQEGMTFRAVLEVAGGAETDDQVDRRIETVARYFDTHARAGVPADRVEADPRGAWQRGEGPVGRRGIPSPVRHHLQSQRVAREAIAGGRRARGPVRSNVDEPRSRPGRVGPRRGCRVIRNDGPDRLSEPGICAHPHVTWAWAELTFRHGIFLHIDATAPSTPLGGSVHAQAPGRPRRQMASLG